MLAGYVRCRSMSQDRPNQPADPDPSLTLAARGGRARAAVLSPEARSEIATQAAVARWRVHPTKKADPSSVHRAARDGVLRLGEFDLPCAVLDDPGRTRVLSERGVTGSLGGKRGGSHWRRKREAADGASYLPVYLS